jgi:hypothetical protein
VHDKFIKLGIHAPHVIPQDLTKWNIQLMHILAAIAFLSVQGLNFSDLFLNVQTKFWICYPHNIPKVHKNLHNFWPSITLSNQYCFIIKYYID